MTVKAELMEAIRNLTSACRELVEDIPTETDDGEITEDSGYVAGCPFCGNMLCTIDSYDGKFYVHCPECEADGPMMGTLEDACRMWNVAGCGEC
ncbi:MAG: hypothetical protein IJF90_12940 [Synergistaceae bacterium]|nr:hypothetical protein [Synergistaceae bacterium]MBQ3653460.1 hypothetical protein [Synergistaceae bacterium]